MSDLLSRLRSATRDQHQRLHEHPFITGILEGSIDQESYALFLSAFSIPWQRLETTMTRAKAPLVGRILSQVVPRSGDLVADLRAMQRLEDQPRSETISELAAVGYAYCLVGSSMGARTLRKIFRGQLPSAPMRYLEPPLQGERWSELAKELREARFNNSDANIITDGAKECFAIVEQSFPRVPSVVRPQVRRS